MIRSSFSLAIIVKFSAIFPHEQLDVTTILQRYKKSILLKMISVFGSFLINDSRDFRTQIHYWFENAELVSAEIIEKISNAYLDAIVKGAKILIINDYSNVRLSQIILSLEELEDSDEVYSDELFFDVFKVYLFINEELLHKQESIPRSIPENLSGFDKAAWMATANTICYYDFFHSSNQQVYVAQIVKALYCFAFLHEYNPRLKEEYFRSQQIDSFSEYILKILSLVSFCGIQQSSIHTELDSDRNYLEMFCHSGIAAQSDLNRQDNDFLELRNNPLVKVGQNEFVIVNRSMVINKIYSSIYWDLKKIIINNGELGVTSKKFRTDYTSLFSEEYLVYKLLQKSYSAKSYKQFSGKEMKIFISEEPDYYIRNGNKLFLYEVKDSFISGLSKQSFNVSIIEDELKKKYRDKGVQQLVNRVKSALLKRNPFDTHYNSHSLRIFPILIVYDINLTIPGIESQLISWFHDALDRMYDELDDPKLNRSLVSDIVILHIDGLVLISDYLRSNEVKMEDLIAKYTSHRKKAIMLWTTNDSAAIITKPLDILLSFQHYVMDYLFSIPRYRRIYPPELFKLFNDMPPSLD